MKKIYLGIVAAMLCAMLGFAACGGDSKDDDEPVVPDEPTEETTTFACGADVSWLTEMEASGTKFYTSAGVQTECMSLLKSQGVNAIRLRVWVNPTDGWNGQADVLAKAVRARNLGLKVMVDFHYSDTWADPSSQTPPAAWSGMTLAQLKTAVAEHTTTVLKALKAQNVDVAWVQVGNETSSGMLWETGRATGNTFSNFAQLINAGYDAVKSVYSDAQVIVHLDRGQELDHLTWMFSGLQSNGAKWDVIGLSLYPEDSDYSSVTTSCLNNMRTLNTRYGKPVMMCEWGMSWDSSNAPSAFAQLVQGCKAMGTDKCLGVFYWEPECYGGWKGYTKGAFNSQGRPTGVLSAFNS